MYGTISANKTGGCINLIDYLDKEESITKDFAEYLGKEGNEYYFFNGERDNITKDVVIDKIDHNCKGLRRNESRFYSLTFNPSQQEIKYLQELASLRANQLSQAGMTEPVDKIQDRLMRSLLQEYTRQCMDKYAQNFQRDTIKDNKDLVWFGRVETNRYWKYTSPEVKHNRAILRKINRLYKKGLTPEQEVEIKKLRSSLILESDVRKGGKNIPIIEMLPKSGYNYHVHVIVSRKDREQKVSLSPLAKARLNKEHQINGRTCKIGFNRDKFSREIERTFDTTFSYEREWRESYEARKLYREDPEKYKEILKMNREDRKREETLERGKQAEGLSRSTLVLNAGERLSYNLGVKYIDEHVRPYKETIATGIKGLRILVSKEAGRGGKINAISRQILHSFIRAAGYAEIASVVNPYIMVGKIVGKVLGGLGKGGYDREE